MPWHFTVCKQQSLIQQLGPSLAIRSGWRSPRAIPSFPVAAFPIPALPSLSHPVYEAGQKQPLSVAWPRCKIYQTGIWVCSARQSQAQLRHPQLGLAENTHRYSCTLGHSPKERFAFLIGSIFWEGKWWIITASAGTWDGMKATQTPRLRSRIHGLSHMLIDFQPWEETVLQKTSLLPPRMTGSAQGHLSRLWSPQLAFGLGELCCISVQLQTSFAER